MQYEVNLADQTREIGPKVNGSFNNSTYFTQNFIKNQPEFCRTCGFRGDFRKSLNFHFKPSKVSIIGLYFRQNLLKVEKWFLAIHREFLNDPDFSRENRRVRFLPL